MSRYVLTFALAGALYGPGAVAQVGNVRGTIRYDTGLPLVHATVWTVSGQTFRDTHSDSLGRFHLDNLSAGTLTIEVLCPAERPLSLAVPIAVRRAIVVEAARTSELNATLTGSSCEPIAPRDAHVRWRGWYSVGFENSSFRPCPVDTLAREVQAYGHPFGRMAWVNWPPTAWRAPGLGKFAPDSGSGGERGFVEWSGTLHGPAPTGHLGIANYRLTVDSVFSLSPSGRC